MRDDLLQLDEWRTPGGIDFCYEVLKEPSSSKDSYRRELPRESSHSLKLLGNHNDFHFVKVDRPLGVIEYAAEFFFDAVLDALDTQRVT
jgi:hypothetical protein